MRPSCSPLHSAAAGEALQTSCKRLWPGSDPVQSRGEEQGHVSHRRSGLPASGISSLAVREAQCTLPLHTFPSPSVGYYMFIEASRPRVTGDKARLISPLYNITAKYYCVSFYYHMYGKHIGEYPPGKGKPSLEQAVREDLQPLALPAVPAASYPGGWESYSGVRSTRVGCCFQILVPYPHPSSVRVVRLLQPILGAASCSQPSPLLLWLAPPREAPYPPQQRALYSCADVSPAHSHSHLL